MTNAARRLCCAIGVLMHGYAVSEPVLVRKTTTTFAPDGAPN